MSQSSRSQVSDSTNKSQPDQDNTPNPLTSSAGQGTHTRQTHSGSISEIRNCSLLDVLHQVPTLPEIMTADSQKALSAPCKSCHVQFIAQVQIVTVGRKEDCALVLQRMWPRLSMVIVQKEAAIYMPVLQSVDDCFVAQFANIKICIRVATKDNKRAVVALLRPQQTNATDVPWTRLAAQQLAHQLRTRWPQMHSLTILVVDHIDRLSLEVVSQLAPAPWTRLTRLCLSGCKLTAEGIFHLIHGNWPCLTFLDVSGNGLNAAGMARLAYADWPSLRTIIISFHCTLDANTIDHLLTVNWPGRGLFIKDMPISADMAAELADAQVPSLWEFTRADWPMLRVLSMCYDDPAVVGVLVGFALEKVQERTSDISSMVFPGVRFNAEVCHRSMASQPSVGLWLKLKWIDISHHNVRLLLIDDISKTRAFADISCQ